MRDGDASAQDPRDSTPAGLTASIELVERAQSGDEESLQRLFVRYYPRVHRVVRSRMGVRLRGLESPEDIVQNTFIAALGSLQRFEVREDADLIDWFARLVENQLSDASKYHGALKRESGRKVSLESFDRGRGASEPVAADPPALEKLSHAEQEQILDECIVRWPIATATTIARRSCCGIMPRRRGPFWPNGCSDRVKGRHASCIDGRRCV